MLASLRKAVRQSLQTFFSALSAHCAACFLAASSFRVFLLRVRLRVFGEC